MRMNSKLIKNALILLVLSLIMLPVTAEDDRVEPEKVVVQHILIGFKGTVRGKKLDRTKKQAQALAKELLQRAQDGEDFDALVKEYTDDQYPGYIPMANTGIDPMGGNARNDMVPSFGDVSFSLEVGEIGMAPWHYRKCEFGWHIIKRLE